MGWNGTGTFSRTNGVYSGSGVWNNDSGAGVAIVATRHDTHDQDLATGINACLCKNGENSASANLPMGGYLHTNVAAATAVDQYARVDQIQKSSLISATASGGSANAQVISLSPALTAGTLVAGTRITFIPNFTNTGATTLTVNALSAKTILYKNMPCVGGELFSGIPADIIYDGTNFQLVNSVGRWVSWTPTFSASGSMTWPASASRALYRREGTIVFIKLYASGTTGGTSSSALNFTLPISAGDSLGMFPATIYDGTATIAAYGVHFSNSTVSVSRYDGGNIGLGQRDIAVSHFYESS